MSESIDGFVNRIRGLGPVDLLSIREACSRALVAADWTPLADEQVIDAVQTVESGHRRDTLIQVQLVAEVRMRSIPSAANQKAGRWLSELLRLSARAAWSRVHAAEDLAVLADMSGEPVAPRRPATAAMMAEGVASAEHHAAIAEVLRKVPTAIAADATEMAAVESTLAQFTRTLNPNQLRTVGIRLLAHLNPDGEFTDDTDRQRRRKLSVSAQDVDHMSGLTMTMTPATRALWEVLAAVWAKPGMNNPDDPQSPCGSADDADPQTLETAAERDTRSTAQRNYDAFHTMLRWITETGTLGQHRGLPAQVIATMTLAELETETGIATTASGGTLPVRDALALAGANRPFLALLDDRDRPLFLGRQRRLASPEQRIALIAADKGCTRPGCDQPADRCQVHHIHEWADGGRTDITVLTLACDNDHAHINGNDRAWITDTITTATNTGRLPDGRTARIGWTRRGSSEPRRGNTIHQPQQYVDWFRRRLEAELADDLFRRQHPDSWTDARRWETESDHMPPPDEHWLAQTADPPWAA